MVVKNFSITSNTIYGAGGDPTAHIASFIDQKMADWVAEVNANGDTGLQIPQRLSACTSFGSADPIGWPIFFHRPEKVAGGDPVSGNYGIVLRFIAQSRGDNLYRQPFTNWSPGSANNGVGNWTVMSNNYVQWWNPGIVPIPTNYITYCADNGNRFFMFYSTYFGSWGFAELLRPAAAIEGNLPPVTVGSAWCMLSWDFQHPMPITRLDWNQDVWAPSTSGYCGGTMILQNPKIITRSFPVWGYNRIHGYLPPGIGVTGNQSKFNRIRAYGVDYTYLENYVAVQTSNS